jgi:hypothetical protein
MAQGEGPEFKPQYYKNKQTKKKLQFLAMVGHAYSPSYSGG